MIDRTTRRTQQPCSSNAIQQEFSPQDQKVMVLSAQRVQSVAVSSVDR
jgi:hypothetical protein